MSDKLRAVIIGCGRMGAGRDHKAPFPYTHIEAYQSLADEVEVVGFVDRVYDRAAWAADRWGVSYRADNVPQALRDCTPDLVSICTPPSDRYEIVVACDSSPTIRGIWCEKPYGLNWTPFRRDGETEIKVQVNYIRRFDRHHQDIRERRLASNTPPRAHLVVMAANDIHTTSHFTDLADWWRIRKDDLLYIPFHGPSLYILRETGPATERYYGWHDEAFLTGGIGGGGGSDFMREALENLIRAVRSDEALVSPAGPALYANEAWAEEIVLGRTGVGQVR